MKRLYEDAAYDLRPDAGNYWQSTVTLDPAAHPLLERDLDVDVAVIGAGIVGLNAALRAAEAHSASVAVLDAAWVGWGASGRNGGFVGYGGSKLPDETLAARFGLDQAKAFRGFQREGVEAVAAHLSARGIDADRHSNGEWLLAHRPRTIAALRAEAETDARIGGKGLRFFDRAALAEQGVAGPEFLAGLLIPGCFAINPLKYTLGLARAAQAAGVRLHGGSRVKRVRRLADGRLALTTDRAELRARRLVIGTNGYTEEEWIDGLSARLLPALSNILVTRPLTDAELAAQGYTSDVMAYETRTLLHYFRLMPNRRFLFGMRGGLSATPGETERVRRRIRRDLERMFPAWAGVETPYFWSGFVCLARDLTYTIAPVEGLDGAVAAVGCHGSGVAIGTRAGAAAADLALGAIAPADLPAPLRGPLRRFPAPGLRRGYLRAAYAGYRLADERA